MKRRQLLSHAATCGLALCALPAFAQERGPIRLVLPYSAGGQSDSMARMLAPSLARTLGQPVLVDNRPGAAGLIATRYVQQAAPDGDTLLLHNTAFVGLPLWQKDTGYDPQKDFLPVAYIGGGPTLLMIHSSVPAKSLPEFIAYVRTLPDGIEAATAGQNTSGDLATRQFARMAGIKVVTIPYKGAAETARALISGEARMQLTVTTDALNAQVAAGRVRILGAATAQPSPLAPGVPTIAQTVPGFVHESWFGLFAPAGTPAPRVVQIAEAVKTALADSTVHQRYLALNVDGEFRGPEAFGALVAQEVARNRRRVAQLGIEPQ